MEVSDQVQAHAALPSGKQLPIESRLVPEERIHFFDKIFSLTENRTSPSLPVGGAVITSTELYRFILQCVKNVG